MAKKVSENDIQNMTQDWGLDTSNNLPYSGAAVQKFIKETFVSKIGCFHYDASSNRYLCFSDNESRDKYLANPTMTELVLGSFDAPFNYEASITMLTPSYNAVFVGGTGNYLDFTFDIRSKDGNHTGENVNVTYTFIRNSNKKVVNETRKYGETVHFNIDGYLLEGTNTVIVGITGQTSLAATTASVTYQVVNLSFSDNMDISKIYNLASGSRTMEVFFTVSGYGTKMVEWFLDGTQLAFVKSEDEVVDVTTQRTKYVELSNLSSGVHTLQSRAYTLVNGERFYTDTLYREFMVSNGDDSSNLVAIAADIPHSHGIVTESNPLLIYGIEQYIPYEIRFSTKRTGDVSVILDGKHYGTVQSYAGSESRYSITVNKAGTLGLKLSVDNVEREIPVSVNASTLGIEEITGSMFFDFQASGKSNSSVDRDEWSYGEYKGTFSGFNWNASSGWVDGALLVNKGASFSVDISPLSNDATVSGKTLEFEFSTRGVENDDAVICDLTSEGKGLLITASEARLTSAAGEVVSTRFKAGEVNRIAFVINRKTGVTFKGLAFIYVNGILSGAVNYGSADNFVSSGQLSFVGTEDAQVELRSMRFYDTALSADNILNNYILYRSTLEEMMEVYYRNEIYAEGTQTFSPDAMLHRLPVMVITGDIPTLEAATSTSTQILVDIEYTNEQEPSRNFRMKNAALRIQGTSSLSYPRKNFRFYTQKEESTVVYDSEGKKVESKLYSFKDGAQPVDCWCLKADFAESSGTHNTGIARLWNKSMYGAVIQHKNVLGEEVNGYALRTKAQVAALNAGYEYDVRTTIDGFPIVLFYKKNAEDTDLIFLGKYNFNNDKSTPSVFGFENIPGFDNSRMQCWETRDNGHPLGLFTDISGFDANWSEAFESRYPDTKTPATADLKAFSLWINGVSQSDFAFQKWAHFDVYKVAAYYCYLMRFGAVDQPVKNAFLTSEDGEKFFFINYDNDTINGLINTGRLVLDPTVNRDTIGSDGEYVYAGHNSVLWNKLTADSEFMEIVSIVDNALYSAGLRYAEVVSEFNDKQADKWVERVYNQDAEYKYLLPYVNQATNNLFMLQGARSSHRSWWLSKRFSLYDSIFLSGAYRDRNISFKCLNDTQPGQQFVITSGTTMNYGYGVNNGVRETGVEVEKNATHTFVTTDTLNLGDVVKVFASANIEELDLSRLADRLAVLDCSAASDPSLGTKMKRLVLGGSGKENLELPAISGINALTSLQELNVEGYRNMTSLDLTAQRDLRKVYAKGSAVASMDFAAGAPVEHLELPSAMMALNFNQLPYLTFDGLVLEGGLGNVHSMNIYGCANLTGDFDFVSGWLEEKTVSDSLCTLSMDNVNWSTTCEKFIAFSQHKADGMAMELKGKVYLESLTLEQLNVLAGIWGNEVFGLNSDFRITAPSALYINPSAVTLNEGESVKFTHILISDEEGSVEYSIVSGNREGTHIDPQTGVLTTVENGLPTATVHVRGVFTSNSGKTAYSSSAVSIKKRVYPTSGTVTIEGAGTIRQDEVYTWTTTMEDVNGDMTAEWSLTGGAVDGGYISLGESDVDSCKVKFHKSAEMGESITASLKLELKKKVDGSSVLTKTTSLKMAVLCYPSEDDTVITGESIPSTDAPVYTWESTATGEIGPISVQWHLDEALLPYYAVQSQEWDQSNPLQGSCTLVKVADVEFYLKGNVNLTITRVNTGESFTVSKQLLILSPDVIMTEETNKAVLDVMYSAGLCSNSAYMTRQEAEAVVDGSFNPTGSQNGSIFYNNKEITSFDEFRYFTGMSTLDAYAFNECANLRNLSIPDSITKIGRNGIYNGTGSKYIRVNKMGSQIVTLGYNAFENALFDIDLNFANLKFSSTSAGMYPIYNGTVSFEDNVNGGNTFYMAQLLERVSFCNKLIVPSRSLTYKSCYMNSSSTPHQKIEELYIPDFVNYCNSTFSKGSSGDFNFPVGVCKKMYAKDPSTGEYAQVTNFTPGDWQIGSVSAYAFCRCQIIESYNAVGIQKHNTYSFYDSGIRTLVLDNMNGTGTIAAYAFARCKSLTTITDNSVQPWASLDPLSFNEVNDNVTIDSQVFGLYKQSSGFTLSPMDSGVIHALAFGEYTFNAPSGAAFSDGSTSKVVTLGAGNKIQDLTDVLRIGYLTLAVTSNLDGAQFKLAYTASDGTAKEEVVSAGSYLLEVTKGANVTVTPENVFKGYISPSAATVTMSSTSNSIAMNYTEEVLVCIADTDGNLYSEEEWTASGKANDQAEGVCVMRSKSGGFIIAKEDTSSGSLAWGGYNKKVSEIVTTTAGSEASLDFYGEDNTKKIIEQLSGYASSGGAIGAPAAEACDAYLFPSGESGYLPALGEWIIAYNNKAAVNSVMSLIGGTAIENTSYCSSTQYSSTRSWCQNWSSGYLADYSKNDAKPVRAFSSFVLVITSSLHSLFNLEYTNNYGDKVTEKVSAGKHNLNVKAGTQVTVTPDAIGNITAEPQTFTWQGFTHECNFVFAKDAGVYIQHVNGSLHTESEWTAGGYANSDANGVAVLSAIVPAFVIAKKDASSSTLRWGGYGNTITDVANASSSATAILDYDGAGNTEKIIEQLGGYTDSHGITGAPAAEACAAFIFPNSKKGYLPAMGEWKCAYDNKTAVVSVMALIGGTALSGYYWSSSQNSSSYSWCHDWNAGYLDYLYKSSVFSVRAFAAL